MTNLSTKSKYQNNFDIGVLDFNCHLNFVIYHLSFEFCHLLFIKG